MHAVNLLVWSLVLLPNPAGNLVLKLMAEAQNEGNKRKHQDIDVYQGEP